MNEWLFVSNRHFSSRSWGGVRVRTSVHSESVSFECVNIFLFQRKKPTIENSSLSQFTSHVEHTHEHSSAHSATVREIDAFRLSMRRTHFIYSFVFFCFKQLQLQAVYFVKSLISVIVIVSVMQCFGSFWDHYTLTVWHFQIELLFKITRFVSCFLDKRTSRSHALCIHECYPFLCFLTFSVFFQLFRNFWKKERKNRQIIIRIRYSLKIEAW